MWTCNWKKDKECQAIFWFLPQYYDKDHGSYFEPSFVSHFDYHPRSQGLFPTPPPQRGEKKLGGGRGREKALGTRMFDYMLSSYFVRHVCHV